MRESYKEDLANHFGFEPFLFALLSPMQLAHTPKCTDSSLELRQLTPEPASNPRKQNKRR